MKYALIGCGRIATNHVKAVLNNGLEFVAACDIVPENIESLLAKHDLQNDKSIARYTDYKEMIAEHPELELVAIATSSGNHAEIALYCIDNGINVIIEKQIYNFTFITTDFVNQNFRITFFINCETGICKHKRNIFSVFTEYKLKLCFIP